MPKVGKKGTRGTDLQARPVDTHAISLLDFAEDHSSCGVGFITRKSGTFSHDIIEKVHEALCAVPHRGGMGADGTGDGAGICVDLSPKFFEKHSNEGGLEFGKFAVGNFFLPARTDMHDEAIAIIDRALKHYDFHVIGQRRVPVNKSRPLPVKTSRASTPYPCPPRRKCSRGS